MLSMMGLAADSVTPEIPFPEPALAMVEACIGDAVDNKRVLKSENDWKYICSGAPAETLWSHLETFKIKPWEQTVSEGTWLSRSFPMGGCFRQLKDAKGNIDTSGLSCTIWVRRK